MNAVATIAYVSAALALYAAVLAWRISLAPGSRDERWFAAAAAAAAVYTLCSPPLIPGAARATVLALTRVQVAAAVLHFVAWIRYVDAFLETPGGGARALRRAANVAAAGGVAALAPGLAVGGVVSHAFPAWGVVYQDALLTPVGNALLAAVVVLSLWALGRLARAAVSGVPDAALLAGAFGTTLALGIHDAFATTGRFETPLLLEVGFAVPIVAVAWMTTGRFVNAMRTLERLRGQLAGDIEVRTRELAGALDALNQAEKLAALGAFASGVAHEVNSPASVVTTNLRYLADATAAGAWPADGGEALADALTSMQRINDLVRRLVDAGRTAATSGGAVGTVPVAAAVAQVADEARRRGGPRLAVKVDVPAGLAVRARREALEQALASLVANAVEAIPADRPGRIALRAARGTGVVRISVTDDGAGMPPEVLRRALEPFFTTKPAGRGAGLGLAVARALVEGHGGALWLESAPGVGTTAFVELPEAEPPPGG